jgi:polyisoprenoid-binding protein YceI
MRYFLFAVAILGLQAVGGALLAQSPALTATHADPQAPSYAAGDIYLDASRVYVKVDKKGLGHVHGVVGRIASGTLHLGEAENAGQVVFDLTTFRADTPAARKYVGLEGESSESTQAEVTSNMLGENILHVERFATATFTIKSALPAAQPSHDGLPQYELIGSLELHGATVPVRFLVEVQPKNGWHHVRGGVPLKQTDFGITPFSKAFGAIGVADTVQVWGDIWVAPSAGMAQQPAVTN